MIHFYKKGSGFIEDKLVTTKIGYKIYLTKIKRMILDDKFELINRQKNIEFIQKYNLVREKIKEMILKIELEDIFDIVEDMDYIKYGNEPLIICIRDYILIDMFGKNKKIKVYVKIKLKEGTLPIISFHESK